MTSCAVTRTTGACDDSFIRSLEFPDFHNTTGRRISIIKWQYSPGGRNLAGSYLHGLPISWKVDTTGEHVAGASHACLSGSTRPGGLLGLPPLYLFLVQPPLGSDSALVWTADGSGVTVVVNGHRDATAGPDPTDWPSFDFTYW
jgi:hypothetical protein